MTGRNAATHGSQTVSTLTAFFMAMVFSRDKQSHAQKELDRVIGQDRLPEFADRASLPYVEALMLEVVRLYPVLPLGANIYHLNLSLIMFRASSSR